MPRKNIFVYETKKEMTSKVLFHQNFIVSKKSVFMNLTACERNVKMPLVLSIECKLLFRVIIFELKLKQNHNNYLYL
jgi:hypothetical protein